MATGKWWELEWQLVLLCEILLGSRPRRRPGVRPWRRELPRLAEPVIDPRLLVTPQHCAHPRRDLGRTRPWPPQQLCKDLSYLRRRHRRSFFFPTAAARPARTRGPTASASCDAASPSNCVPHSGSVPPPGCLPRTTVPRRAAPRAPAPPRPAAFPCRRCSACTTFAASSRHCGSPADAPASPHNRPRPWSAAAAATPAPPVDPSPHRADASSAIAPSADAPPRPRPARTTAAGPVRPPAPAVAEWLGRAPRCWQARPARNAPLPDVTGYATRWIDRTRRRRPPSRGGTPDHCREATPSQYASLLGRPRPRGHRS